MLEEKWCSVNKLRACLKLDQFTIPNGFETQPTKIVSKQWITDSWKTNMWSKIFNCQLWIWLWKSEVKSSTEFGYENNLWIGNSRFAVMWLNNHWDAHIHVAAWSLFWRWNLKQITHWRENLSGLVCNKFFMAFAVKCASKVRCGCSFEAFGSNHGLPGRRLWRTKRFR